MCSDAYHTDSFTEHFFASKSHDNANLCLYICDSIVGRLPSFCEMVLVKDRG